MINVLAHNVFLHVTPHLPTPIEILDKMFNYASDLLQTSSANVQEERDI